MKQSLIWLAGLCACSLAAPALAGTWANTQLCWGSDGTEDGMFSACTINYDPLTGSAASTVSQTLPNPDGSSPDQYFLGQASATATADTWRVSTSLLLENYRRDNYIWTLHEDGSMGAATTAYAAASTTDTVTISGGTGVYSLQYILSVDGLLGSSDTSLMSASFCASLYIPGGTGVASFSCFGTGQATPSSITLSYADLPFGGPITPTITISVNNFVTAINAEDVGTPLGDSTISVSGYAEFGSTVHLASLLVTDAAGNVIPGLSIDSDSGFSYPLDPQNTAPVPEPASLWLLSGGLVWLLARRRFS